jgi:hypothetical protein
MEVVPFLEDLIGVRYFPPVTFLVDEQTVHAARQIVTIDSVGDGEDVLEHVLGILRALALGFHVGKLVGSNTSQREAFFEIQGDEARAAYTHVVRMTEAGFIYAIKDHLMGKDILANSRLSLKQVLESLAGGSDNSNAREMVRQTLNKAHPDESATLSKVATAKTLEDLGSLIDSTRQAAASQLLASDLPQLAEQYGISEFFGSIQSHSLRNHETFPEYFADFISHWLSYIKIAASKRPNAMIEVGYSAPAPALEWLRGSFGDINLAVTRTDSRATDKPPECFFMMPIGSYEKCVEYLSELLKSFVNKGPGLQLTKLVGNLVSTHGIYVPAFASAAQSQLVRCLTDRAWPKAAALQEQHKILLCMGAIERFKSGLVEFGWTAGQADDLAQRVSLSVLIHEHFHAAIATGLDQSGRAALGSEHSGRWEAANHLNESLAVWCERHFFRCDPIMLEQIDKYISSGVYPAWPYRGAEVIESLYMAAGTPVVRGVMRRLRDDPENAQREFDQRDLSSTGAMMQRTSN